MLYAFVGTRSACVGIDIVLVGQQLDETTLSGIEKSLPRYGLSGTRLVFQQAGFHQEDLNAIKASLTKDILANNQQEAEKKEQILKALQEEAQSATLRAKAEKEKRYAGIASEVYVQYPDVAELFFSDAYVSRQKNGLGVQEIPAVIVVCKKTLKKDIQTKIRQWLRLRMAAENLEVVFVNS